METKRSREVRMPETEAKYVAYLKEERAGCPFCFEDGLPRIKLREFKYWYITENLFPYDKLYSKSHMLIPFRHVNSIWEMNEAEQKEFLEIRKAMNEWGYDEILENLPGVRTQRHFHQHLFTY